MRLRLTAERRRQLRTEIEANAQPRAGFFALLFLATIIAAMGLLANSAAVIIGAMLIAPLMNAILGLAMGTVTGDRALSVRSGAGLAGGVLVVVTTALIAGSLIRVPVFADEIISRTHPTLLDLLVAVAAGLAGAYSLVGAGASAVLPGVAIATALVPPLGVVGLELSVRDWLGASAASLLFLSNFLAIYLAAALFFTLAGFAPRRGEQSSLLYRRYAVPVFSFVVVGVILTVSLRNTLTQDHQRSLLRRILQAEARRVRGAELADFSFREGRPLAVQATVRTPMSFDPARVAAIQGVLDKELGLPVRLVVRSIIAKDADAAHYIAVPGELNAPPSQPGTMDDRVTRVLAEAALDYPGAVPLEHQVRAEGAGYVVQVRYRARAPLGAAALQQLEERLSGALNAPVRVEAEYVPAPGRPTVLP